MLDDLGGFHFSVKTDRLLVPAQWPWLVVPSLESELFCNHRLIEWNRRSGLTGSAAFSESLQRSRKLKHDVYKDVFDLHGVPTKHFIREELDDAVSAARMDVVNIEKVEYSWKTVFTRPPR